MSFEKFEGRALSSSDESEIQPDEDDIMIYNLYKRGETARFISKVTGIDYQKVRYRIQTRPIFKGARDDI